jgi:dTDP-4-dehydrorhamnose 3,5-epimerase-like enzyme
MKTVEQVNVLTLSSFQDEVGALVPINLASQVPFNVKRIFYVYNVPTASSIRGEHAHYKTKQLLICLNGSVKVTCKDGKNQRVFHLQNPSQALYIPEMIWDEQEYTTKDSVLLVFSSTRYNRDDYIENWEQYLLEKSKES